MTPRRNYIFGHYYSRPTFYNFNGLDGWLSVPSGHSWAIMTDNGGQIWVSPNPLTKNVDGTVTGSPLYAASTNLDGTLVYQDAMANRQSGIDSPPPGIFPPSP